MNAQLRADVSPQLRGPLLSEGPSQDASGPRVLPDGWGAMLDFGSKLLEPKAMKDSLEPPWKIPNVANRRLSGGQAPGSQASKHSP